MIFCRTESEGSEEDEDGFDAGSKSKKMRPDEDSVKAKKQLTVKFGFGKKKKGAAGKDTGLDSSTMFQIAAAKGPAEGGSGEQTKAGKVNELLELEMRARAIKALLNKKPEGGEGEGDDVAEGGDDEAAEEEEEEDAAAEQKKAMEEQKRLQKAREALMVSEAKRREEDDIREKKQDLIRQRIEAEVKRLSLTH